MPPDVNPSSDAGHRSFAGFSTRLSGQAPSKRSETRGRFIIETGDVPESPEVEPILVPDGPRHSTTDAHNLPRGKTRPSTQQPNEGGYAEFVRCDRLKRKQRRR